MIALSEDLKKRFNIFGWVLIIILVLLISRLIYLQLIEGDYFREQSIKQAIRNIPIDAPRGNILDKNGVKLATNKPSFSVEILKSAVVDANINDVILRVVNILEKNNIKYKDDLPIYLDNNGKLYFNFQNPDEGDVSSSILISREKLWKKNNNIREGASADEAWNFLKKNFNISPQLSLQDMRKVMAIRELMVEQGYNQYQPVEIAVDVNQQAVAEIEENHLNLPGIMVNVKPIRYYPYQSLLSQTLGYIGRITEDDVKTLNMNNYRFTDLVGHSGLEGLLEKYLKGKDGGQQVEVDSLGRLIKKLNEIPPKPGDMVYLTIDKNIQEAAEKSLQQTMENIRSKYDAVTGKPLPANIGAAVVVDVNTGKILALASIPGYDPNIFATGNPPQNVINELFKNRNATIDPSPTFNYATQGAAPPGSTFKMATALAALESGATTVNEQYLDPGIYPYTGQKNWLYAEYGQTQGWVNVSEAIKYSVDTFFYEMGRRMGINKIVEYAHKLGLDQKTGIELYEAKGTIASPQFKRDYNLGILKTFVKSDNNPKGKITQEQYDKIVQIIDSGNLSDYNTFLELKKMGIKDVKLQQQLWSLMYSAGHWSLTDTCSASIGQGDNQFTPLEIASYISMLVNGGTRYRLHLIDKIVAPDGEIVKEEKPQVLEKIDIPEKYIDAIKLGMKGATEQGGTASEAFNGFPIEVGGKTGTAEVGSNNVKTMANYAWFVGFAPYDKPKIAVAAVIYQGGSGAYTAAVARGIFDAYFGFNNTQKSDNTSGH
jgi:penicillin-binding protein 2